jgi:hypothetical protein
MLDRGPGSVSRVNKRGGEGRQVAKILYARANHRV